jgi:hypothetical protein
MKVVQPMQKRQSPAAFQDPGAFSNGCRVPPVVTRTGGLRLRRERLNFVPHTVAWNEIVAA